ncbi:MAG TPA: helix-turn-helix transcriptional regulator, partial [Synergistaceae bacterium]|nr:helix-turn-helix transcriptional regulator [Synergistaceae bacterium]
SVLGLATILLWQWLTVLEGSLFSRFSKGPFPGPNMEYAFFCLILCIVFFSLARWEKFFREKWLSRGVWAAAILMSLAWLPWGSWLRGMSLVGEILFLALPAVGSAVQLACWQWRLSRAPFSLQALSFGFACAFRTLVILLIPLFLPSCLTALAVLLPFLGAFLWTPPGGFPEEPRKKRIRSGERFVFPPRLAFRVLCFFGVSAMFLSILLVRQSPAMILDQKLTDPLYSLGALGMGLLLYRFSSFDLRGMYPWAQGFVGLGFLLFAALGEGRPFLPLALLQLGFGVFGAYVFTILLYLGSRAKRKRALSVVATGQGIIMGSILLGLLLMKIMELLAFWGEVPFVRTASLLGIGLLFFSSFFFRDSSESFAGYDLEEEEIEKSSVPGEEELLHLQLLREGLSSQEIRVALLVARGYSNGEISQELNVTGNTLRSHLKKIHKKIGSANRKELRKELLTRGA